VAAKAIVVGGGIGGLTAAIALGRAGVEVAVFERAPELREIGAGISLWANATRALKGLGVYEEVRAAGAAEIGGELRTWRGGLLTRIPADDLKERFGEANLAVHRADLQGALYSSLPPGTVRLGAEFTGFDQDDEGVLARYADGREERGDLLVGADGLHSSVRGQLFGQSEPRYAGYAAWRGIAGAGDGSLPEGIGLNLWGRGSEFGLVGIGRGRFYWFATKNAPEGQAESAAGRKREVLDLLSGAYQPARAAVEATPEPEILRNDIYDRKPTSRWGVGRATLLGDAAHPMTPSLGQGACQAIEDAVVLARCLDGGEGNPASLRLYEERRVRRTTRVVRRSRLAGRVIQLENPLLCSLRDALAKRTSARAQLRQYEEIVRYEP
jgi:2-polyprenyl-6-methoxyphenol hydroxylase-like FAD-dependent oxidoreductase